MFRVRGVVADAGPLFLAYHKESVRAMGARREQPASVGSRATRRKSVATWRTKKKEGTEESEKIHSLSKRETTTTTKKDVTDRELTKTGGAAAAISQ